MVHLAPVRDLVLVLVPDGVLPDEVLLGVVHVLAGLLVAFDVVRGEAPVVEVVSSVVA